MTKMMHDTIYALSTILGKSGVAVIRISGNKAKNVLQLFTPNLTLKPRIAYLSNILSPRTAEILDKAIVIFFENPNSFTGYDVVEMQLHGSIAVIKDVLHELALIDFIRCAEPGEFTKMAFENGKMDLVEVEALSDLIHAETSTERRIAIYQISGHLTKLYESWRSMMINIMAQFEAYIDFPDDDIPHSALEDGMSLIKIIFNEIEDHLIISEKASMLINGVHIAIGGPPNVGKSSILNLLSQQEIAIVSEIAGTTRDVLQVKMDINNVGVIIYDTAGIRYNTTDQIEVEGIRRARNALDNANIKIYVFDATKLYEMDNFNLESDNTIILINKCDLISNCDFNIPYKNVIPFSVYKPDNLKKTFDTISNLIAQNTTTEMLITTQYRQQERLYECVMLLKSIDIKNPLEIIAQQVRQAVIAIECITGKITLDDVLDKIFSSFCIGK